MSRNNDATDASDRPLKQEIRAHFENADGVSESALIAPILLSAKVVRAVVAWKDTDVPPQLIVAAGHDNKMCQILILIYLATRPSETGPPSAITPETWHCAHLLLPDPFSRAKREIHVQIHRKQWMAAVMFSNEPAIDTAIHLPESLRKHDAGTVAVEAASQLLLGIPFLAADPVRNWENSQWLVLHEAHG